MGYNSADKNVHPLNGFCCTKITRMFLISRHERKTIEDHSIKQITLKTHFTFLSRSTTFLDTSICLNFSGAASDNMTADIVAYLVASILVVVLIIVVVQVRERRAGGQWGN